MEPTTYILELYLLFLLFENKRFNIFSFLFYFYLNLNQDKEGIMQWVCIAFLKELNEF